MRNRIKRIAARQHWIYQIVVVGYLFYGALNILCFLLMRIFPVKQDKIVFSANKGQIYGDNPKYIAEAMLARNGNYDIVWLSKNPNDTDAEFPKGMRVVKYGLLRNAYELSTAKVWVDNTMKDIGFIKRKGQKYFQPWHGSYGVKKAGFDVGENMPMIDQITIPYNMKSVDMMMVNSAKMLQIYRSAFQYDGPMLMAGSPRNDTLICNKKRLSEQAKLKLAVGNRKVVLYAPTFRSNYLLEHCELDYRRILEELECITSEEWIFIIRLHPLNISEANIIETDNSLIINASNYNDIQELLAIADVLITDYSSCMFDYINQKKPCFLYVPDIDDYKQQRGNYYELGELPFPYAVNNDEMIRNIQTFDEAEYMCKLDKLFNDVGLCESGKASEYAANQIEAWLSE